ncbi:Kunitz/Bovine pancreatic trypsin inhibitor domain protein [Ancylostoma ceylanicum]|uniref:Kunitz/Bovine pancreatic trypsin inhibitor domain protein n=1 Tax=Ancylostoma ceylanicum TaxID=53326 RepID=A0A0D6LQ71_9BILA|nr:Kunitz/Bovine pancreatic trypsin inhibitor domain protein [Ancylostoma ceylanicum]
MDEHLQDHHLLAMLVQRAPHACKAHTSYYRKNPDAPSMLSATLLGQEPAANLVPANVHRLFKQQQLEKGQYVIQQSWEFIGCDDYPEVHDCIAGLCCPTRALTCIQPMDAGYSSAGNFTTTRWYHDPISYSCQSFQFAGAGDFICSEFGAVSPELIPQDSFLEVVPYSSGSQREGQRPVTRWYWNRTKKDCLPFVFFGQGGNFNNFLTKEHCSNFCSVESVCNQPMSEGVPCLAAPLPRFWFNASAGNCQRFIYNGCQGNSNSFQSLEACQKACEGVEAEPRCPHGSALRIKYGKLRRYFDGIASSCRSFLFHGCDGNINNFPTKQICDEFCPRTALSCPYGGEYHRRGNGEAVECSSDKQCPFNYFCTTMSRRGTELRLCCPTRLSICSQGKDEGINCGQPATSMPIRICPGSDGPGRMFSSPPISLLVNKLRFSLSVRGDTAKSLYISRLLGQHAKTKKRGNELIIKNKQVD